MSQLTDAAFETVVEAQAAVCAYIRTELRDANVAHWALACSPLLDEAAYWLQERSDVTRFRLRLRYALLVFHKLQQSGQRPFVDRWPRQETDVERQAADTAAVVIHALSLADDGMSSLEWCRKRHQTFLGRAEQAWLHQEMQSVGAEEAEVVRNRRRDDDDDEEAEVPKDPKTRRTGRDLEGVMHRMRLEFVDAKRMLALTSTQVMDILTDGKTRLEPPLRSRLEKISESLPGALGQWMMRPL